jgi:hypothetical protein
VPLKRGVMRKITLLPVRRVILLKQSLLLPKLRLKLKRRHKPR